MQDILRSKEWTTDVFWKLPLRASRQIWIIVSCNSFSAYQSQQSVAYGDVKYKQWRGPEFWPDSVQKDGESWCPETKTARQSPGQGHCRYSPIQADGSKIPDNYCVLYIHPIDGHFLIVTQMSANKINYHIQC